jgi:hypothetical protein
MEHRTRVLTGFGYLDIITAHLPLPHPAILRKRPILETVAALPLHTIMRVLVLVPELDSNLVFGERKQLLAKTVALLPLPFLGQEFLNPYRTGEERRPVSPDAVRRIRFGNCLQISVIVNARVCAWSRGPTVHSTSLELS